MRIITAEFESTDICDYNFLGSILSNTASEPFTLRHEYFEGQKDLKQSLYLFGNRRDERGTQVFIHRYTDVINNTLYTEDVTFYNKQAANFKLPNKESLTRDFLLPFVHGEKTCHQFMTKDRKFRRRIVYNVHGERHALMIILSIDSALFSANHLFAYVKNNFAAAIG